MDLFWKCLGFAGTALFAARWLLQLWASRRAGRPVTTTWFWICSLTGSGLLLVYFGLGPSRDSVGVLGNALPSGVALYNLSLSRRWMASRRRGGDLARTSG